MYNKADYNKMREHLQVDWEEAFRDCPNDVDKQWNIFIEKYEEAERLWVPRKVFRATKSTQFPLIGKLSPRKGKSIGYGKGIWSLKMAKFTQNIAGVLTSLGGSLEKQRNCLKRISLTSLNRTLKPFGTMSALKLKWGKKSWIFITMMMKTRNLWQEITRRRPTHSGIFLAVCLRMSRKAPGNSLTGRRLDIGWS